MKQHQQRAVSSQSGMTLTDTLLALMVLAAVVIGIGQLMNSNSKDVKLATVASRMTEVRTAADRYIRDNFSTLETSASSGPITIPINSLINSNYLPASYSNTNEYQQTHYVYVRRRAAGVLESIVVATGGQAMNQYEGGKVAQLLKGPGGFVSVGSANAIGTKGAWTMSLASFVPGGMPTPSGSPAAYSIIRKSEGPSGALMRVDTGNPEDNRMATNLDMDWHDILNVRNINVGTTTINQSTIQNINDLGNVNCNTGEVLTKSGSTFMCVQPSGMPAGGTAAFTGLCPSGWSAMPGAEGRVLVGSGAGYSPGQTGGNDWYTMTVDQMPNHGHKTVTSGTTYDWELRTGQTDGAVRSWSDSGGDQEYSLNTTNSQADRGDSQKVGGGQAFDNRQAYIVVNWCRKQ